jgi:GntP family gluconate:H+ symporter
MHPFLILGIGVVVVVGSILIFRLHAFLALILGALVVAVCIPAARFEKMADQQKLTGKARDTFLGQPLGERVARSFGNTCAAIGIMIAMAAIIGQCSLESGGADRIVRSALGVLGEKGAPVAFSVTGFILGIPVFFDTVFYLMIPLGKALAARTGKDYGLYVMSIAAGATISHSLVPPTPGPLYVAGELKVVAEMTVAGIVIGGLAVIPGVLYAYFSNRRWPVPLRETPDVSLAELKAMAERDSRSLPPLWLALLPILLPVVLIVADVCLDSAWKKNPTETQQTVLAFTRNLGNPNVALGIAAVVGLLTQIKFRKDAKVGLAQSLESALGSAGQIILITAAGGAFGGMLQQTGVGDEISALFRGGNVGMLVLIAAFLVTGLIRVAQGSATVAMVTAVGMFSAFALEGKLPFHPVYLALAIGFGSKLLPWMNDSGFWVVCKMSGQSAGETLRNHSTMFTIMGVVGFLLTLLSASIFPFKGTP